MDLSLAAGIEVNGISIVVLLMLYFGSRQSGVRSYDQYQFTRMLWLTALVLACDTVCFIIQGTPGRPAHAWHVSLMTVYYLLHPVACLFWALYSDFKIFGDEKALRRRRALYLIPAAVSAFLIIASLWTGWVFRVDAQNIYHRGPLNMLFTLITCVSMLFSGVLSLCTLGRAHSADERREHIYLAMFMAPPFIGAVIQTLFYGVMLIWPCIALSLMMVYITIQNKQISTDALTGINNRRNFDRYLSTQLSMPEPPRGMTLFLLDIDGFKTINDTFGHLTGDAALIKAAEILKQYCTGRRDFLARYGGDEFAIIRYPAPFCTPEKTVADIAILTERFNRCHSEPFLLSFSVGSAVFGENGIQTVDALIHTADRNMYMNKSDKALRGALRRAIE